MGRLLLAACLLSACIARGPRVADLPQHAALRRGTVYVPHCGTGWVVSQRYVVTNLHVARCVRRWYNGIAWVLFSDGSMIVARGFVRATQRFVDLALIELDSDTDAAALPLGDPDTLTRDMEVLTIGNPQHERFAPNRFRVLAHPALVAGGLDGVIVLAGEARDGESGSPVATPDGKVVGVLFARRPGQAYAVPIRPYLQKLLDDASR